GELEHRHVKRFYARSNRIAYEIQIARKQRRRALLQVIRSRDTYVPLSEQRRLDKDAKTTRAEARERHRKPLEPISPSEPYDISKTQRSPIYLPKWLHEHKEDPATKGFLPILVDHLLGRILNRPGTSYDGDYSQAEQRGLQILDNRIYPHKAVRRNYTTYDMRRDQDYINPVSHLDIMVLADQDSADDHPFWYARVIGVYHANIRYVGPGHTRATSCWQHIHFLWVRWFERDISYPCGFQHRRHPRVRFVDATDPDAVPFSFVDPSDIVRAAYIMPGPAHGETDGLLGYSPLSRRCKFAGTDDDYYYYYVSM
ncbi:hypothetical protein C8T65DRAFT_528502, partial [Cerioporus squamosus]